MKSKIRTVFVALIILIVCTSCFACGKKNVNIDPNKTQIYVYVVDNGMGYQWVEKFAEEFNAMPENGEYEVIPQHGDLDLTTTLDARLAAGATEINIYFGSQSGIKKMIANDRFIDISDVYLMKVDSDGGTIADKTPEYEMYKSAFSDLDGSGIYAVPYTVGVSGLVFDYDFFIENDYLIYAGTDEAESVNAQSGTECVVNNGRLYAGEAFGNYDKGDVILSAGKDGVYGTYDDGQAETLDEFYELILNIVDNGHFPYIYTTKYADAYTRAIADAALVQSMGYENYLDFMSLNGEIKGKDGAVQATFDSGTGSVCWNTEAVLSAYENALSFYNNNVMGKIGNIGGNAVGADKMIHPSSYQTTSFSHKDAQDAFVSGFLSEKESAFMIEGVWWEGSEARRTLESLEKYSTTDDPRGYGVREYRYYLLPEFSGQISDSDVSVLSCQDDGCGVLLNNIPLSLETREEKNAFILKCKEFIAYTLSDEALQYYTSTTGIRRPFDYELDETSYAALTPFQRNTYDMLGDSEHIKIVYPNIIDNISLLRSYAGLSNYTTDNVIKGATQMVYTNPYSAFKSVANPLTVQEYINGIKGGVSEKYQSYYDLVKEYINV